MQINHHPTHPSNQKFGWFFAAVFAFIATYLLWRGSTTLAWALYSLSFIFLIFTLLFPDRLFPLNKLWFGFGIILGNIISPIVLGIMFFILITPVALITRVFGRDEIKLKKRITNTYWVNRNPAGPLNDSFKNQY
jgi:hypothetical protein